MKIYIFLLLIAIIPFLSIAQKATITWNDVSSDWQNTLNWTPNSIVLNV